jgi:hypothetical protein
MAPTRLLLWCCRPTGRQIGSAAPTVPSSSLSPKVSTFICFPSQTGLALILIHFLKGRVQALLAAVVQAPPSDVWCSVCLVVILCLLGDRPAMLLGHDSCLRGYEIRAPCSGLLSFSFVLHFSSLYVKGCSTCYGRRGWFPWGRLVSCPCPLHCIAC